MKTSTLDRNGVSAELVDMISRLDGLIPWPYRRQVMGEVAVTIIDGKTRVNRFTKHLLQEGGHRNHLPTVRTISNILNRHGYRLRTVEKTKVQKNGRNRHHLR